MQYDGGGRKAEMGNELGTQKDLVLGPLDCAVEQIGETDQEQGEDTGAWGKGIHGNGGKQKEKGDTVCTGKRPQG